jgi:dTDP-4-amino-4,6-dideoxygalactose transaminase
VIVHAGATPVFTDITADVFNIDPDEIGRKITPRTKAVIPVHYGGHPCDMDEIVEIAQEHDLLIIEDAAHAPLAEYKGRKIGTIGDLTCFSFYATKNLTTAEGGMITTNDEELAEKLRMLSLHGLSRGAWKRYSEKGSWYYEVLYPGYKYNMTDIQAALGLHQLAKLRNFQEKREEYVSLYDRVFREMSEIETPQMREYVRHAWHLYPILINPDYLEIDRGAFIEALKAENIGTSVHFIPLHLHPYYQETFGLKRGDFPITEQVYDRILSLPLYPKMTETDVEDVIIAVKKVVGQNRKRVPKLAAVEEEQNL